MRMLSTTNDLSGPEREGEGERAWPSSLANCSSPAGLKCHRYTSQPLSSGFQGHGTVSLEILNSKSSRVKSEDVSE